MKMRLAYHSVSSFLKSEISLRNAMGFLLVLLGTGFFLDRILIEKLTYDFLWKVTFLSRLMTEVGDATVYYILSIGLWVSTSLIFKYKLDESVGIFKKVDFQAVQTWAKNFLFALLSAAVVIHALKMLVGRMRPYATAGEHGVFHPWIFDPLTIHPDFHSFPSGHSQVVFCAFVAFSSLLKSDQIWAKRGLFLFFAWVAFTRVPTHNHFLTDVLMGSLIGYLAARYFFWYRKT